MKRVWIAVFALAASFGVFAQGQVNFDTRIGTSVDARILAFDFGTGTDYFFTQGFGQLLIVNANSSLTPLLPIGAFGTSPQEAGYIDAGVATAPTGYPGGTAVNLVMRAWFGTLGSTYETAMYRGQTGQISITLSASPEKPADLVGLQGFLMEIPEPSALALGALAVGAMLLRRRR